MKTKALLEMKKDNSIQRMSMLQTGTIGQNRLKSARLNTAVGMLRYMTIRIRTNKGLVFLDSDQLPECFAIMSIEQILGMESTFLSNSE